MFYISHLFTSLIFYLINIHLNAFLLKNQRNITSISDFHINSTGLTITSFHFHDNEVSDWIPWVFGKKAVHLFANNEFWIKSTKKITESEILNSTKNIRSRIDIDSFERKPYCSIDLQGAVYLSNVQPFTIQDKSNGPSIGQGDLYARFNQLENNNKYEDVHIQCHYRAIYEPWKKDVPTTKPNYWTIVLYCPIWIQSICNNFISFTKESRNSKVNFELDIQLYSEPFIWSNNFSARLYQPYQATGKSLNDKNQIRIGICLAIPYTSSDTYMLEFNKQLFSDWITYHSRLGMMMFIYDRDGANYDAIQDLLEYNNVVKQYTIYHNYTMRGLLVPSDKGLKYDNNEIMYDLVVKEKMNRLRFSRFLTQGVDKTLTLTHCRFEAKAIHGIDRILVIDFDEFLYCPRATLDFPSQYRLISDLLSSLQSQNIDQVTVPQVVLANRTVDVRDCFVEHAMKNKSIFDCLGEYKHMSNFHSHKSFHLGHKCPLTGYHQACSTFQQPRAFDCLCPTEHIKREICSVVHLTTKKRVVTNPKYSYTIDEMKNAKPNEISILMQKS